MIHGLTINLKPHLSFLFLILGSWGFGFNSFQALAHPVTFEGGTAVFYTSRNMMSMVEGNHSISSKWALGGGYQRLELLNGALLQSSQAQVNWLAKRWNRKDWQGNLYLTAGAGYFDHSTDPNGALLKGGFQADWESRTYYVALMHNHQDLRGQSLPMTMARLGVAPYHAKYTEMQSWLIWQIDYAPDMFARVQHTPMMRFFYRNILWEIGSSLEGVWWLQLMSHF